MKKAAKRKEEGWVELETIEKISKIIQSRDQKVIQQQSKITK
jgi:tRNA A58 N-methylase Trm61